MIFSLFLPCLIVNLNLYNFLFYLLECLAKTTSKGMFGKTSSYVRATHDPIIEMYTLCNGIYETGIMFGTFSKGNCL